MMKYKLQTQSQELILKYVEDQITKVLQYFDGKEHLEKLFKKVNKIDKHLSTDKKKKNKLMASHIKLGNKSGDLTLVSKKK